MESIVLTGFLRTIMRTYFVIIFGSLCCYLLAGCSVTYCEEPRTRGLCEQIMRNPELLLRLSQQEHIKSYDYWFSENSISEKVNLIKQHFSVESVERECEFEKDFGFLQYSYYGDNYYSPKHKKVIRAYIRFLFVQKDGVWKLTDVYESPRLKYPEGFRHNSRNASSWEE